MSLRERTRPGLGIIEPVKNPKAPGEVRGGGGLAQQAMESGAAVKPDRA